MNSGGVEAVVMNYYRNINRERFQFDFICHEGSSVPQKKEIESLGGRVFFVPSYSHVFGYQKALEKLFRQNHYSIVHGELTAMNFFSLKCAKKASVPVRICHAHSTEGKGEFAKNLLKNILKPRSRKYATDFFACSKLAGTWLFGKEAVEQGKVFLVRNAIDTSRFLFHQDIRDRVRKEEGWEGKTVYGHVGRFCKQKNQKFLLSSFKILHEKKPNSFLVLVGEGELFEDIRNYAKKLGIFDCVSFLGLRKDVNELMQGFDSFLLPSHYEGLPVVGIEAQVSGLPCFFSDKVTREAQFNPNCFFFPISDPKNFANQVLEAEKRMLPGRKPEKKLLQEYDIQEQAKCLESKYEELLKKV